ncbi:A-type ATP synthase subunit C [Halodesulfurarchaeum formicicum]|uniref:A-type ATP synthase subunit C n=1 Tax=Halodesulfurarchaeum formicicum TaxID=1873524 RepID=A0A1D8S6J0_9EURY|nr:ATP synthase A1 subunit C [Halodesulfurarchaeum formicicum]AOW80973.1 A-type ATP synthase subunit C [Halodesulfurarchaeum formicicum]APE96309.1 A-type ATP synthase subunit C [Halodesulfurarchaeum formicicum]
MTNRSANYEYVVARVRHRRASLFAEEDYRKLLGMGLGGIARFMEESPYQAEINDLGARYSGVQLIEYALNRNLARAFDDLLRFSEGELYELVARYLRKFDAWNLKTVLRGRFSDAEDEEIEENLIDAGELEPEFLDRLIAAPDIEAIVEIIEETTFGDAVVEAYPDYEETGLLTPLENAIDRAYYEGLLEDQIPDEGPMALYAEFLRTEIDFRNVRNVLRIVRSGAEIDPREYFIEGGQLFDSEEIAQLATDQDQLITHLRESRYGKHLGPAIDSLDAEANLTQFERALDEALLSFADRLSHVYPLSVCPVLAYILAKEREVDNIRAIAHGKETGLDRSTIENELVML